MEAERFSLFAISSDSRGRLSADARDCCMHLQTWNIRDAFIRPPIILTGRHSLVQVFSVMLTYVVTVCLSMGPIVNDFNAIGHKNLICVVLPINKLQLHSFVCRLLGLHKENPRLGLLLQCAAAAVCGLCLGLSWARATDHSCSRVCTASSRDGSISKGAFTVASMLRIFDAAAQKQLLTHLYRS
jgi:hypothetical protein